MWGLYPPCEACFTNFIATGSGNPTQSWKCLLRGPLVQNHHVTRQRKTERETGERRREGGEGERESQQRNGTEMKRFWICWIRKKSKSIWVRPTWLELPFLFRNCFYNLLSFFFFFLLCICLIPSRINGAVGWSYISLSILISGKLSTLTQQILDKANTDH